MAQFGDPGRPGTVTILPIVASTSRFEAYYISGARIRDSR